MGAQAVAFWAAYRRRVNEALETEFSTTVTVVVEMRVRRPVAHKFEPHLRDYADFTRLHLETTGDVPRLALATSVPATGTEDNVFRREGEYWTIRYAGQEVHLRDAKGLQYIAYLLREPRRQFHVLDLVAAIEKHVPDATTEHTKASSEQLAEQHLRRTRPDSAGPALDAQARDQYRRRLQELPEEIEDAKDMGNWPEADRLETERDFLIQELTTGIGRGERDRPAADPVERARQAISASVKRSLNNIKRTHPALWQHLHNAINSGIVFSYTPDTSIRWNV